MATVTTGGTDFEIRNITLNSTTDTPIDFTNRGIQSALIRCRTNVDVYIRKTPSAADYITIPSGSDLDLNVAVINQQKILCYARAASGNPILEVLATL